MIGAAAIAGLPWLRIARVVTVVAAGAAVGWTVQGWRMAGQVASLRAEHQAAMLAAQQARTQAQQRTDAASADIAKQAQEAQNDLDKARQDAARARGALADARQRLLDADTRAARSSQCPATAANGSPSGPAIDVRADVLSRATEAAIELAAAADAQHAYAVACAARYRRAAEVIHGLREAR